GRRTSARRTAPSATCPSATGAASAACHRRSGASTNSTRTTCASSAPRNCCGASACTTTPRRRRARSTDNSRHNKPGHASFWPGGAHGMRILSFSTCLALALAFPARPAFAAAGASEPVDVVVYGGTSAAVASAIQAKRMGKSVVIVSPDNHLGGLTSGGLGWTDSGTKGVVGGVAREFYARVKQHY